MIFSIESKCYNPGSNIVFDNIMNKYCTYKNDGWIIDIETIHEIKDLLNALKEAYDKNLIYQDYGWCPDEIVIDVYYNCITLRDSYIE